jgi:UDP-N-acetylmuramoyl-tripeptide--D-alanyl-D-alanine ligase
MKFIANTSDLNRYLGVDIAGNIPIKSISTDSRSIKKNSLFIAIKGENFDGNDFVEEAITKGALYAIADKKKYDNQKNKKIIYVKNTVKALKKISGNIINEYKGKVIAVTGSNGKTTTTNIISKTLKNNSKTLKNFNNEIGMPLSIMNASSKSKNLVLEIGASKFGDIDYLSKILKPHVGVITNIGHSHLEKLGNVNGVFEVKSELINNIKKNGFLIVPSDNKEHLDRWKKLRNDINILTFGIESAADFYASKINLKENGLSFVVRSNLIKKPIQIKTSIEGKHNIKNILASFAVHFCLKEDLENFVNILKVNKLNNIRQIKSKWINGSTLIDDTYNANPDSTKKSIDLLSNYNKNTVLILGDMLELGRYKKQLHKEVGVYAKKRGINIILGYGDLTKYAVDGFGKKAIFFKDEENLKSYLRENITSKDVILIKGSRGMKMEKFKNV